MALENRLEALKKKHADIDQQILEEVRGVSTDQLVITHLKSLKLSIKDEIERLSPKQRAVA
jgi:hypothetical protein